MYVEVVPNRSSRPAILLRESWREGGRVRKRTLANLSDWPAAKVQRLRAALQQTRGGKAEEQRLDVHQLICERSAAHGHVAAVLGTAQKLGLRGLLSARSCPEREHVLAMVLGRIIDPCAKLALAQRLSEHSQTTTLALELGLQGCNETQLYGALDWLVGQQGRIEKQLAKRHMQEGTLALYDVTSSYFEGRKCPLAKHGYSRDKHRDRPQIVIGLLCNAVEIPVACEVFDGNTADPRSVKVQVEKLRERFGLKRVVLVGDRGMLTSARIDEELKGAAGIEWISALTAPKLKQLCEEGSLQVGLFDERKLGEILSPAYPGERLIVCRNPLLTEERRRKRALLLEALETKLEAIAVRTRASKRPLRGRENIALKVGKVMAKSKVGKLIDWHIEDDDFRYERNQARIDQEAALDGFYVLRTSLTPDEMNTADVVRSYKQLGSVERAFRCLKTVDLHIRPIYHYKAERVKAHVLVCMLAYYVEWHMKQALAPLLFAEDDLCAAQAERPCPVAKAAASDSAKLKAQRKKAEDGTPVCSFQSLLRQLAAITRNWVRHPAAPDCDPFTLTTTPNPLQQRALDLLAVTL
ncbi:MAG: IS1634 family transposase [Polyangiales bacterium]